MTSDSATTPQSANYTERLVPGPGIYVALLLAIPAVALILTPVEQALAWPVGVAVYIISVVTMLLLTPVIKVAGGQLTAGHASIPIAQLGEAEALGAEALRQAIGPGLDARSYLLVRGWIHRGVRIENIDPSDPAPFWILTTRHPQKLIAAIDAAKASA